ncbi:hypothetical protein B0J12DRAFT_681608, partial [Macrophomina phaseolina]
MQVSVAAVVLKSTYTKLCGLSIRALRPRVETIRLSDGVPATRLHRWTLASSPALAGKMLMALLAGGATRTPCPCSAAARGSPPPFWLAVSSPVTMKTSASCFASSFLFLFPLARRGPAKTWAREGLKAPPSAASSCAVGDEGLGLMSRRSRQLDVQDQSILCAEAGVGGDAEGRTGEVEDSNTLTLNFRCRLAVVNSNELLSAESPAWSL